MNLREVADLSNPDVGSLKSCFDSLRRFVGKLDGGLKHGDGELGMNLGCYPQTELVVHIFGCHDLTSKNNPSENIQRIDFN